MDDNAWGITLPSEVKPEMRYIALVLLFSTLWTPLRAQTTLSTDAVKKMVVFIYPANADGTVNKWHPLGTGFLIAPVEKGSVPTDGSTSVVKSGLLLVTARHIVDPAWLYCSEPQPTVIYLRLNTKNYDPTKDESGVEYVPIFLIENGQKTYFVREDDDRVDAAVVSVALKISQDKDDFIPMRLSVFASPDEIKQLAIGDSIASAGLLPGRSGEKRNYPFFKFGAISNIPDEPTWVGCGGRDELRLERVWFVAANLVGGNSGSPIFYVPPEICVMGGFIHCTRGLDRPMIIGVQSSAIGDPQYGGADVAGMTPIEDVFKIIEQHSPPSIDLYRGDESKHK